MTIQVGQVWSSAHNRYRVDAITLGTTPGSGKVRVTRLPQPGRRLPPWDDGVYVFASALFAVMDLELPAAPAGWSHAGDGDE